MDKHNIPLDKIVLISTDGAKSMTGIRKGFFAIVKEKINHEILVTIFTIHISFTKKRFVRKHFRIKFVK